MTSREPFFNLYRQGFVRVALAAPLVRIGDPAANAEATLALMREAAAKKAAVAVFPELGLSAYSCEDLFHQQALLRASEQALAWLLARSKRLPLAAFVGLPLVADGLLYNCAALTNVAIGSAVSSIGDFAFYSCASLPSITIPGSVTRLGTNSFEACISLTPAYFQGNAPGVMPTTFFNDNKATGFYLPGSAGWGPTFSGIPTALWLPQVDGKKGSLGLRANQFGFNLNWASGQTVVVEASTSLASSGWAPVATNTLIGGTAYFSDPQWTNYPGRFYRLRWP